VPLVFPGWESSVYLWANAVELLLENKDSLDREEQVKLRLMLQRVSSLPKRDEVPTLVQLERKIRRVLARGR